MASCSICNLNAVFSSPYYCIEHFINYFEAKVKNTLKRFDLVKKGQKAAVAVSGGKDSQTVLYLLNKFHGNVTALSIDEGIPGYRDRTLLDLKKFCLRFSIPYQIYSFKEEYGNELEGFIKAGAPACRSCGVMRRNLLNKKAAGFDIIATGHNLDDECQSLLMNLFKGNLFLCAKMGPKSGISGREGFTQRIKPLYLCGEKEVAAYAFLKGFPVNFAECPHASEGFRSAIRDLLNDIEHKKPGTKLGMIEYFLKILPILKNKFSHLTAHNSAKPNAAPNLCSKCSQPSMNKVCRACVTVEEFAHAF